jgi:hypothetical protein
MHDRLMSLACLQLARGLGLVRRISLIRLDHGRHPVWGLKIEGPHFTRLLRAGIAPLWPHTRAQPARFISRAQARAFARRWGLPLR